MTSIDRNAPCPCGSGRKYKRCCLEARTATAAPLPRARAYGELVDSIFAFAERHLGIDQEDLVDHVPEELLDEHSVPFWLDVMLFHAPMPKLPIAEMYLSLAPRRVQEDLCRERLQGWPAVLDVLEIVPDKGFRGKDRLTGEEVTVDDRAASRSLAPHLTVLAFPCVTGGHGFVGTAHPQPLRPTDAAEAVKMIRRALKLRGKKLSSREELRRPEALMRVALIWSAQALAVVERPDPELCNTDGDPLLIVRDHYAIPAGMRRELLDLVARIEGAQEADEGDDGIVVPIQRPGNAVHASWDNTIVGHVVVETDGRVHLESNSERRADALREKFESACGSLVRRKGREIEDPRTAVERRRARSAPARRSSIPKEEEARILREFKASHYARWPDETLPALDGMTPRQAARGKAAMRERLRVLLSEMEYLESRLPEEQRHDFAPLRRELGLSDPA